ncbi:transporter [Apiospora hydei]|uniref:Transporter n=1 Tax=Apiospora hydei TaxID=1337664 RepID=A0ABR1V2B8_9PEZI
MAENASTLPTTAAMHEGSGLDHSAVGTPDNEKKTSWASRPGPSNHRRRVLAGDSRNGDGEEDEGGVAPEPPTDKWWKIHLFRGMVNDLRRRAPYYWSDWRDAWDYRVVPATVYMYFANIMPALAFSLDMFTKTGMQYGVNEVLLASVLGAVVFSILACQPLVIVGVTGPITVFNYTVYDIMMPTGTNYLAFMCWIGLWSLVFHWILAITNSCNWLKYVTRFPCDIFGFYVLERFGNEAPFYLSIIVALLVFMIAYACGEFGGGPLFRHSARIFLKDYGTPLTVIFFTGFVHLGRMKTVDLEKLPTSRPFFPTADRGWFVHFWDIPIADIFIAIPFAVLLTVLFWFDHNVSSLIAQGTEFPLRKPAGFHWDTFLLGLTTGIAGLLGLPFPNGLIPQAPFHTESLCVTKVEVDTDEDGEEKGHYTYKRTHVVEQRVSNLAQGLLTLGTMTGPLLIVLHLIPQAVLAGLFFIMGYQALEGNGITPPAEADPRRAAIWAFVALELVGFGATFAITQTVAAVGFPVFILALIPVRALLLPRLFTPHELSILDEPTASPFTMENVGGSYGGGASSAAAAAHHPGHNDEGVDVIEGEGGRDGTATNSESASATLRMDPTPLERRSEEDLAGLEEGKGSGAGRRRGQASRNAGGAE